MPLKVAPDPNKPGAWIWVDSATNQPATQPGGANTPYVAPSDTGTTNVNIDPNAGAPARTGPAAGPAAPGQPSMGGYTVAQIADPLQKELDDAHTTVNSVWDKINTQTKLRDKAQAESDTYGLNAATSTLTALYGTLSSALQRVESANAAQATAINTAIHNGTLDPSAVAEAQARATQATSAATLANTQATVLQDGADTQKEYVAAQAGLAAQQGLLAAANADLAKANASKIPAEIATAQAQTNALQAQANETNGLLDGKKKKLDADTSLTQANVGLTDSNSDLAKANAASANADAALKQAQLAAGLPAAQVGLTTAQAGAAGAQGTQSLASAASQLAGIQKDQLGGIYGLQDKINAIRQIQNQVFGPGGSGDPSEANDLLQQYTTASIAGTTPYESNVAAANAGLTAFGTQASLANAAQAAAASRANAYTGFGGSVLSTLAGMNANAPAGSTAMAGAFGDVMNQMQQRLQAPQFAGPAQPTPPTLPALLQNLAGGGSSAVQPGAAMPAGPPLPGPAAAPVIPQQGQQPQTSAPITINVGGQAQPQSLPQMPTSTGMNVGAMPGAGPQGQQSTQLPGVLQQHAPATIDDIGKLWGNQIQAGIVRSPYAAMGQAG